MGGGVDGLGLAGDVAGGDGASAVAGHSEGDGLGAAANFTV